MHIKIEKKTVEKKMKLLLEELKKQKLLDEKKIVRDEKYFYIPIKAEEKKEDKEKTQTKEENKKIKEEEKKLRETIKKIIEKTIGEKINFETTTINSEKKPKSVKEILKPILKEKIKYLKSSFDLLGRIAIIEETEELKEYNKKIAEAIMKIYPSIKSVYLKSGIHEGEYRIQPYSLVLGENNSTTTYIENKVRLYLDIKETYFTPRLANERLRIAKQIKKEVEEKIKKNLHNIDEKNNENIIERILVLFSGISPYPITIEKNIEKKYLEYIEIEAVELNPKAHEFAEKNLKLNKTKRIKLYNEDAKKFLETTKKSYDRILMPLPKHSKYFLLDAVKKIKNEGIIHFYYFVEEKKIKTELKKILETELKPLIEKNKIKYEILEIHKVGQYAPRKYRVCADIKIYKE